MPRKINTNRTSNSSALKDGVYELLIINAEEGVSKSNNDMVILTLKVVKGNRQIGREIKDYMVYPDEDLEEGEDDKYSWKFDQLHNALNVEEGKVIDYRFYKGKRLYASLKTEAYGEFDNNKIDRYLTPEVALARLEEQGNFDPVGVNEDSTPSFDNDTRKSANAAAPVRGRKRQAVAELDDDDTMPL